MCHMYYSADHKLKCFRSVSLLICTVRCHAENTNQFAKFLSEFKKNRKNVPFKCFVQSSGFLFEHKAPAKLLYNNSVRLISNGMEGYVTFQYRIPIHAFIR